ncbi:hypothetical protein ACQ676_000579 [Vibrio fluvialis]
MCLYKKPLSGLRSCVVCGGYL